MTKIFLPSVKEDRNVSWHLACQRNGIMTKRFDRPCCLHWDRVCESWLVQLNHSISQLEQKAVTASSGKPIPVDTSDHWSNCHGFGNRALWIFCINPFVESDFGVLPTELALMSQKAAQVELCAVFRKYNSECMRGVGASSDFWQAFSCYTIHLQLLT